MTNWPRFDSQYFWSRCCQWMSKSPCFFDENGQPIKADLLEPESLRWKRRFYWPNSPVSQNICNCVLFPTCMHSMGAAGMLLFLLMSKLVDTGSDAYHAFIDNLKKMNNYLQNGNIVGSTSTLLNVIHELSPLVW